MKTTMILKPHTAIAAVILLLPALVAAQTSTGVTKLKDFTVYRDQSYYCAFPSLVLRGDGSLLCAFRRAPSRRYLWGADSDTHTDTNSYLVTVESRDGGSSWTAPKLFFAHPMGGSQDPCMVRLKDGSIICTSYGWTLLPDKRAKELKDTVRHGLFGFLGGYILRSDDEGQSWKGPFVPPPLPAERTRNVLDQLTPAFNRGAMMQARDGRLLWAVVQADDISTSPRLTSVHLMQSLDKGESWSYVGPVATDPNITFNETSLLETESGDILAFMRTEDFDGKATMARSRDGGKSFEKWEDGGFVGQPFHAARLNDGRIFMVYGYRRPPFGIRAKLLNKNADDFRSAAETIIRDDGGAGDLGYPWATLLPDGNVMVVYYMNVADGPRHIAGSILKIK